MVTLDNLNKIGIGKLPGHLGIVITHAADSRSTSGTWRPTDSCMPEPS
jgi:hypothetical protein